MKTILIDTPEKYNLFCKHFPFESMQIDHEDALEKMRFIKNNMM